MSERFFSFSRFISSLKGYWQQAYRLTKADLDLQDTPVNLENPDMDRRRDRNDIARQCKP